jgi:hypothetical protein
VAVSSGCSGAPIGYISASAFSGAVPLFRGAQLLVHHVLQIVMYVPLQFQDVLTHLLVTYPLASSVTQFHYIGEADRLVTHAGQTIKSVYPQGVW